MAIRLPHSTTATATAETGFISAAVIGTATIGGNIAAGTDQGAGLSRSGVINALGTLRSLTVHGSLLGTTGNFTSTDALISVGGKVSGLAIGRIEVDGDIKGADIIAGISTSASGGTFFSADAQIGKVVIKSSKVDGFHIAAGADVGTDGKFGATEADPTKTDDVVLATLTNVRAVLDQAKVLSSIASVVFTQATGPDLIDATIEAQEVDSVTVASLPPVKHPGKFTGTTIGGTDSLSARL